MATTCLSLNFALIFSLSPYHYAPLRKITNAPNDPTGSHESQISLHFALRSLVLQMSDVFGFYIVCNVENEIFEKVIFYFVKNFVKTQNFQTPTQYVCERQWEENSGVWKIQRWFHGGVAFQILLPYGPILTKTKQKSWKFANSKFQKSKNSSLWGPLRWKFRGSLEEFKMIWGSSFKIFAPTRSYVNGTGKKLTRGPGAFILCLVTCEIGTS